ncbi:amidohydrolase [Oryzicola mucosus]|uniref:Amidohydrolase n=1 Tax=Oryzicola mucosus TaxID=2767425 RepID=A0A8J6U0C3_9HYPH|nr:amidohydrolase [Oryzicola mucosus]MBD0417384.1 amidohydrolase [Oryzicola mucosus]
MTIADHIAGFKADLMQIRHRIHAHPELGLQEFVTAELVASALESLGIETHRGVGGTGVVGVLRSGNGTRSVGLRADMDGLPIQEAPNQLPYRSTVEGVSHACGHDGHTAILLGVARYLAETRHFDGVVNLIFQPAEEGRGGAVGMLEDGLFERFPCDTIYALHNLPAMAIGKVAICRGRSSAGGVFFDISVTGKGAHAASPHLGTNPILVGCQIVTALNTLVAQRITALEPAILSVTRFQADGGYNIIPAAVTMSGTIRAHSRAVLAQLQAEIDQTANAMADASGCTATSSFRLVFAPLFNDLDEVEIVADVAIGLFGRENVNPDKPVGMGSEDFAFMLEQCPGAHFFVGNGENSAPVHNDAYDFNDDAIVPAATIMAAIVERKLT